MINYNAYAIGKHLHHNQSKVTIRITRIMMEYDGLGVDSKAFVDSFFDRQRGQVASNEISDEMCDACMAKAQELGVPHLALSGAQIVEAMMASEYFQDLVNN